MQIKKYLIKLWNKIKYNESGQLIPTSWWKKETKKIPRTTMAEIHARYATKKSVPEDMFKSKIPFPTSELTLGPGLQYTREGQLIGPAPSRESYYKPQVRTPERSIFKNLPEVPKVTPFVAGTAEPPSEADTKLLAYLKEYVGQMRAAGFPDYFIKKKLMATKSIFIPDVLPANFGQTGLWATGMADEFKEAMQKYRDEQGLLPQEVMENWIPSPDEYLNYMPGNVANRLPSYSEYKGQDITGNLDRPSERI